MNKTTGITVVMPHAILTESSGLVICPETSDMNAVLWKMEIPNTGEDTDELLTECVSEIIDIPSDIDIDDFIKINE